MSKPSPQGEDSQLGGSDFKWRSPSEKTARRRHPWGLSERDAVNSASGGGGVCEEVPRGRSVG